MNSFSPLLKQEMKSAFTSDPLYLTTLSSETEIVRKDLWGKWAALTGSDEDSVVTPPPPHPTPPGKGTSQIVNNSQEVAALSL